MEVSPFMRETRSSKFRHKKVRKHSSEILSQRDAKISRILYIPRIDDDSLFQATRQITIVPIPFYPSSSRSSFFACTRNRAVSEHPRRVRRIIYRVTTTNGVESEQRQLII